MNNQEIVKEGLKYVMNTYGRQPIALVEGKGSYVYDADGKEYLDMLGGIAVNALGHCHPKITKAICAQAQKLMHCSNLFWIEPQVKLAKLLVENSCFSQVFFCNSGAEANEGAIKAARKYAKAKGKPERFKVITALNSFHGRTMATLAATGQEKIHKNFEPLTPGFKYAELNSPSAIEAVIDEETCAIMVEPIQGEGGIIAAEEEYLKALRNLCDRHDLLLIFDEVQVGMGRTGKLFCYEHSGVLPDIATMAKALGGGTAIGAFLVNERANVLVPGEHGSTFGGNPLATAAGIATLETILEKGFLNEVSAKGEYIKSKLEELAKKFPSIMEIRGRGMLIGIRLNKEGGDLVKTCQDLGLLVNCTAKSIIRLMPALNITREEIDKGLNLLAKAMEKELSEN